MAILLPIAGVSSAEPRPPGPLPTNLTFRSDACADEQTLRTAVARRSERVVFVNGQAERRVLVSIKAPDPANPWQAAVRFELEGKQTARHLEADGCRELIDAVGFVIGVTLDPPSASRPPLDVMPGPTQQDAEDPPTSAEAQAAARLAEPEAANDASTVTDAPDALPERNDSQTRLYHGPGFGVQLMTSATPDVLPGGMLVYTLAWLPSDPGVHFAPEVHLSAELATRGGFRNQAGRAEFLLFNAGLDLCPILVGSRDGGVSPCAFIRAGMLRAEGFDTVDPQSRTRPWNTVGGSLFASVLLDPGWRLGGTFGVGANLVRDTFQFEPAVLHTVGPLALQGSLTLSHMLP